MILGRSRVVETTKDVGLELELVQLGFVALLKDGAGRVKSTALLPTASFNMDQAVTRMPPHLVPVRRQFLDPDLAVWPTEEPVSTIVS